MTDSKPGFIWYELMTSDQDAAEILPCQVTRWPTPVSPACVTILSAGERGMGGLVVFRRTCKAGARPGWLDYVSVPDTDSAAKRIVEAGGDPPRPENIPSVGRFAVVADPGAVFMLLTPFPREDAAAGGAGDARPRELAQALREHRPGGRLQVLPQQFGWQTAELMDMGPMGQYRIFGTDGVPMGG
jgi:predicted enzyme related to lactoylglutathione lyase